MGNPLETYAQGLFDNNIISDFDSEMILPDGCGLFQQSNTPCHKTKVVQEWSNDHNDLSVNLAMEFPGSHSTSKKTSTLLRVNIYERKRLLSVVPSVFDKRA